jgi:AcrR family transcriptional regulator
MRSPVRIVKKPEERKIEIVNAARDLFLRQGYDQTTIDDVSKHLGVAKGTVYHYFDSKEQLLEAVVADLVDASTEAALDRLERSSGNALARMRVLVPAQRLPEDTVTILEQLNRPGNLGMYTRLAVASLERRAFLFARLIEQGCGEGLFQTDAPREAAEFILTAIEFLTDRRLYPWTQDELNRRARAIPTLVETLLQAPPGSFQFLLSSLAEGWRREASTVVPEEQRKGEEHGT